MTFKVIAITLVLIGFLGLTFGVLGIFGTPVIALNAWAMAILGFIFFLSGMGLLKRQLDSK
ncbi:MAG: hypothetical protein CMB80_21530 [Flammeovirgaceae bacterium]|nr:hypothetical protein [Flammeovirgaceae bacterium]MBR11296.1 hypothetical protein [Rickettsiales bacterium]|tara:strand:- start:411 stop:593 length:183 start_codon:yes stop_codon:yes gene_type:complete